MEIKTSKTKESNHSLGGSLSQTFKLGHQDIVEAFDQPPDPREAEPRSEQLSKRPKTFFVLPRSVAKKFIPFGLGSCEVLILAGFVLPC
jgi:hypothetical protein